MNEEFKDLQSIQNLKGVGPKGESSLNNLGIFSISDAAFHLPFRYEDRSYITPITDANYQTPVLKCKQLVQIVVICSISILIRNFQKSNRLAKDFQNQEQYLYQEL